MSDLKMSEPIKRTVNWEKYTALSSMLVAVLALAISIWQSYNIQQHNKLSLRPYLEAEFNTTLEDGWELYINNQGLGPAQVTDVKYIVDGTIYRDRDAFLIALGEDPDCYVMGNVGRFYKVSDRQIVFSTLNNTCRKTEAELMALLSRMQMILDYQSLYGETYQLVIGQH
ncbi:MAG: hypothetical protein PHE38_07785 [Alishewanella agri]|uniref:Uncharacterized protein n=1 Tax=Alishewanella aestuarii B11 TaxID=1197174 RepID=J2IIH1_9ALTE|nr:MULTISPECIES: hypothetical protein [Alishewanella]EJI87042.1 hypothetical protein AEST_00830 [Alishewanella aestuarii B11]MDD4863899.1 hypothetical protein [Alishewanella agri]OCW97050.1 hypothetical protein A9165_08575 [Alishewanella sp. HH-ZS]